MTLAGKTALVTGSTSGIGLGIATALASAGCNIVLNGFGDVEPARSRITGVRVGYHGANLARAAEIADLMHYAATEFGGVDILVNNAGIQHVAPLEDFTAEHWDEILAVNLTAAFHTTRLALAHMRDARWGRILNIASVHGQVASAGKAAYVAAKHGLLGLTKVTALETARTNITCNALCPGWVHTPLVQRQVDDRATRDHVSEPEAREALLLEKHLGATAVFLCSDAASQVRGAAWTLDGGWTAQ